MKLIIAGHYAQARYWAQEWRLGREGIEWRYISGADQLRGLHDQEILFCGTWADRDDVKEIQRWARVAGQRTA